MSILMASDTRKALGDGAERCDSRTLLLDRFPFFDERIPDYKRVALDALLPSGKDDLTTLRARHTDVSRKQERFRDTHDQKFNQRRLAESQGFLEATAPLARRQRPASDTPADALRWLAVIPPTRKRSFTLVTADRLAVGLANGVLENCGLTLHRLFGKPMIPGSALKGVAVDAAREIPEVASEAAILFATAAPRATPERQGAIGFLDAFPVRPDARLEFDVATPHYPAYYAGTENPDATDTENPIPIVFPVVAKNVGFRFTLVCISPRFSDSEASRLLALAEQALRHALTTRGVGAKTASGYGWFAEPAAVAQKEPQQQPVSSASSANPAVEKWRARGHDRGNFRVMIPDLATVSDSTVLEAALPAIVGEQNWRNYQRKGTKDPFWQSFAANPAGKAILARLTIKPSS